jgi:hypothetical protein
MRDALPLLLLQLPPYALLEMNILAELRAAILERASQGLHIDYVFPVKYAETTAVLLFKVTGFLYVK